MCGAHSILYVQVVTMYYLFIPALLVVPAAILFHGSSFKPRFKKWWLGQNKDYPARRARCGRLSRWIQDVFFRLDKRQYQLSYTDDVKQRVHICKVHSCVYSGEIGSMLVAWGNSQDMTDVFYENVDHWGDATHDVTDMFRERWEACDGRLVIPASDFTDTSDQKVMVAVTYQGHAGAKEGVAAEEWITVYTISGTEDLVFPPHDPRMISLQGLSVPHVAFASMDGHDLTTAVRALCGPKRDWYKKANPLTYAGLYFALWASELIEDAETLHVEDSHLDTHTL